MRLGRLPWINCLPVTGAIDLGIVPCEAERVTGTAAALNDLLAAGALDVSLVSAVEYARNAPAYALLPDLAITSDGPVRSVLLLATRPIEALGGATILRSASSRTSVLLLELLCRHRWGIAPRFATAPAEPEDLPALAATPHDAVLVIGDAALLLSGHHRYPVTVDLGAAWREWTGLPFVFAVWAARRTVPRDAVQAVHRALLAGRAWGLDHLDLLAERAAQQTGLPRALCRAYFDDLDYALTPRHIEGLTTFFRALTRDGVVPEGTLSFIAAA